MKRIWMVGLLLGGCAVEVEGGEDVAARTEALEYDPCDEVSPPVTLTVVDSTAGGAAVDWISSGSSACGAITGTETVKVYSFRDSNLAQATSTVVNNTGEVLGGYVEAGAQCKSGGNTLHRLWFDLWPNQQVSLTARCRSPSPNNIKTATAFVYIENMFTPWFVP